MAIDSISVPYVFSASPTSFGPWLAGELFRRFGRRASNRSICIKAGLPENALYRVLTKGERPSPMFCERMAAYLGLPPEDLQRQAGLRPTLEIAADGAVGGVDALSEDERRALHGALERGIAGMRGEPERG